MTHIPYLLPDVRPENDYRTRLLVMGIIMIVLGAFGACFSLTVPVTLIMSRSAGMPQMPIAQLVLAAAVWPAVATLFIWTGIGSIQKRRWVRPIVLVFASMGLVIGVISIISTCFSIPMIAKGSSFVPPPVRATTSPTTTFVVSLPQAQVTGMIVGLLVGNVVVGLGIPLTFLLLYRSQHVRTTLEFCDPVGRWTDACPIPVLGLAIIVMIAAVWTPLAAIPGAMFVFGIRLSGVPLIVMAVALGVLLAMTSRWIYRLNLLGWRLVLVLVCVGSVSWTITLIRTPMDEIYAASGMSAQQLQYASQFRPIGTETTVLMCAGWSVAAILFVLYTRRFFPGGRRFFDDAAAPTLPQQI